MNTHRPAVAAALCVVVVACAGPPAPAPPTAGPSRAPSARPAVTQRPAISPSEVVASSAPRIDVAAVAPWITYQAYDRNGDTTIQLVQPDGSGDHALLAEPRPGAWQTHPAWSPDGSRIAFEIAVGREAPERHEIWATEVARPDPHLLIDCALPCLQVAYPAWSPDGRSLAYMRYEVLEDGAWGESAIEVLDLETGTSRAIATTPDWRSAYYTPRWSPDSRSIVVTLETYATPAQAGIGTSSLVIVEVDEGGAKPRRLTPEGMFATAPDWAPGADIVFNVAESDAATVTTASIAIVGPEGTGLRRLTDTARGDPPAFEPVWAGDSSTILCSVAQLGVQRLASLTADAQELVVVDWRLHTPPDTVRRVYLDPKPHS